MKVENKFRKNTKSDFEFLSKLAMKYNKRETITLLRNTDVFEEHRKRNGKFNEEAGHFEGDRCIVDEPGFIKVSGSRRGEVSSFSTISKKFFGTIVIFHLLRIVFLDCINYLTDKRQQKEGGLSSKTNEKRRKNY